MNLENRHFENTFENRSLEAIEKTPDSGVFVPANHAVFPVLCASVYSSSSKMRKTEKTPRNRRFCIHVSILYSIFDEIIHPKSMYGKQ